MDCKKYKINGCYVYQNALTFSEYEQARELLKDNVHLFEKDKKTIAEIIDNLYDNGILRKLLMLILKFDDKSIWKRLVNRKQKKSILTIVNSLSTEQIARVIVDFFLLNIGWTSQFQVFPKDLISEKKLIRMVKQIRRLLKKNSNLSPAIMETIQN